MSNKQKNKDSLSRSIEADENTTPGNDINISKDKLKNNHPTYHRFPGPVSARAALRIAFDKAAYADLVAHAKSTLENEICGVLAGNVHQDETGEFLHIHTIIPGENTLQGSTNVTFTQETWNKIHQILEKKFPEMQILGWYHTHPGFGTEFSEMDLFIQENFFPLPTQISLLTDPLSGEVAISINSDSGPQRIDRFWIDGREVRCRIKSKTSDMDKIDTSQLAENIQALETRLNQFVQDSVERRNQRSSFVMFIILFIFTLLLAYAGYTIYKSYFTEKPESIVKDFGSIPITIQADDKTIVMQVNFRGFVLDNSSDEDQQKTPVMDMKEKKPAEPETPGGNE